VSVANDNGLVAKPLNEIPAFVRTVELAREHVDALATLWEQGRVAHVFYKTPDYPDSFAIGKMPRKRELRWAEQCDGVTMRFVAGKVPRRAVFWIHEACFLMRLTSEGWKVEPGSTDAERAQYVA
jgi:hypothetical protein